jgi:uncharacterized membrane protein
MFSIKESIQYGWRMMRENMKLCLFSTLLLVAAGAFSKVDGLLSLLLIIFMLIIRIGYTKIYLRMNDGEKPKFGDMFEEYALFWKYLGVSILQGLVVLGGLILVIIPGIVWAVRFSFSPIILIDTKVSPVKAMKESYAITKGKFWKLLGFWLVIIVFNIIGMIIVGVGLLFTVPISMFASIHVYRKLSSAQVPLVQ